MWKWGVVFLKEYYTRQARQTRSTKLYKKSLIPGVVVMSCAVLVSLSSFTQIKQSVLKALVEALIISVIESNFIVAEIIFPSYYRCFGIKQTKH